MAAESLRLGLAHALGLGSQEQGNGQPATSVGAIVTADPSGLDAD